MLRRLTALLCLLGLLLTAPAASAAERRYLLGTASPGGTYYPVGTALATLVKVALQEPHGIVLTAVPTAGSAENIRLMRDGEVQFAILQGLFAAEAQAGQGLLKTSSPEVALRSLTALWQNVEQFVIRAQFSETGTIDDLLAIKGQRIVLGDLNSGTLASSRALLKNLGTEIERDNELVYMGYGPAADAMQGGDVAAVALPAGVPTKALTRLKSAMGKAVVLLGFTADQARRADGGRKLWQPYEIPANTYPAQADAVMSIAQPNVLAVRADVPEEDVYRITRAIYENLPLLHSLQETTVAISLGTAFSGLPMPLHPGAARYFTERGLDIPRRLVVE
ncbi:MAG: TAXI family TRAP transporter solute-binding subunit [Planctomycetota bacterium]|jgi:TRAP transporter TAXI family solute receptor